MSEPSRCPSCNGKLSREESGAHVLYGCDDCGGILAKPSTAKLAVRGMGNKLADVVDAIEQFAPNKRTRRPSGEERIPRACPSCGLPMEMAEAAGVEIDVCDRHGTWFDRGEIALIAKRMGKGDERPDPKPSALDAVDGAEVAFVGIEIALRLLFFFIESADERD